jgi:hypothetical protein
MPLSLCTVSGTLVDASGSPLEDAVVRYQIEDPPKIVGGQTTGVSWEGGQATTDKNGLFSFIAIQGIRLHVWIEAIQYNDIVTVPAATTANLFKL